MLAIKQEGFTDCVIDALELNMDTMNGKATLAEAKSLVKDADGNDAHVNLSYSSIVDLLLYFSAYS